MNDASSNERLEVKRFYDEIGWRRTEDKAFVDAARFEDLRPVSADYRSKCHLRVNRYLPHQGQYLLDVASGPIQFPEYLTYSEGYDYRLCADLSHTALQEARTTLGGRGLYVQCDITHLPFQADSIDTAISLHTIYHVSADNQIDAFRELHRVLRPGSRAVVVYSWSRHSLLMAITLPYKALVLMARYLKRLLPTRDQSQANA